jgi:GPH family glycoside/pentoside/hexuronide:cation symporter
VALTIRQKMGWGLADMGVVVFVVVKQMLVLNFLTAFLGVPVGLAGLVTTCVLVFDMVTDPVVGVLSDRTNSRWGRRAPWMFLGAVIMAGAIVGLFAVPDGFAMAGNIAWVIGFFGLATIGFTFVAIPYGAQAGELTSDPKERSVMTGWRMGFASLGILIGGALVPGLAAGMGHAMAALVVSPLIIGSIWLSLFATRNAPRIEKSTSLGFKGAFGLVLRNRPFVVLTALYGIMTLAVAILTAGLPFAATYLINDTGDTLLSGAAQALTLLSVLFAAFVIGSILSQAIWVLLSHRIGKLAALILGLVFYVGVLFVMRSILPSTNVTAMAGLFVIAGMANGSYQQIPWAIYPDHMDQTRAESGEAVEGAFSAIWLFGQKLANAIAPALLGAVLARQGWQESTGGVVPQSDAALEALRMSMTLMPAAILAVAILGLFLIYRPLRAKAVAS